MIEVRLTVDEIHLAALHAVYRRSRKLAGERGDRPQKGRSDWDNEIEGACAELAVCKARGAYWSGLSSLRAIDGGAVDVRWTKHQDTGGLIVYEHDDDERVIVLVDGYAPQYRLLGWLRAKHGKRQEWRREFGYLVPRMVLRPFKENTVDRRKND